MKNKDLIIAKSFKALIVLLAVAVNYVALSADLGTTEGEESKSLEIFVAIVLGFGNMVVGWRLLYTNAKFRRAVKRSAIEEYLEAKRECYDKGKLNIWNVRYSSLSDLDDIMKHLIKKP